MVEKLRGLEGKKVDINCGAGAMFRGVIESVDDHLVSITDESDTIVYIVVKRIISFSEVAEPVVRPGFII